MVDIISWVSVYLWVLGLGMGLIVYRFYKFTGRGKKWSVVGFLPTEVIFGAWAVFYRAG
jgi:hypothetical protein